MVRDGKTCPSHTRTTPQKKGLPTASFTTRHTMLSTTTLRCQWSAVRLRLSAVLRHNHLPHRRDAFRVPRASAPRVLVSYPLLRPFVWKLPCYTLLQNGLRSSPPADLPSSCAVLAHSSNAALRQATPARLRAGAGLLNRIPPQSAK